MALPKDEATRNKEESAALAERIRHRWTGELAGAREVAALLGGRVSEHPGRGEFAFWTPELLERAVPAEDVYLELLHPPAGLDPALPRQEQTFYRQLVGTARTGEFTCAVVDGVVPGNRERVGTLYCLVYRDASRRWRRIVDPLAVSIPFGAAAPAELYDISAMLAARTDRPHFDDVETELDPDGVPRIIGPSNLLEIHVATATEEGTLQGLADRYRRIGAKIEAGEPLTPGDRSFIGYDAVQLMPVEPTILYEGGPSFWEELSEPIDGDGELRVELRRPDTSNWGYDVITVASPAPNPALLGTGRPEELLNLFETLHNFPGGGIRVVLDIVYGHADNQTVELLNHHYFAGANMYGQNLNYRNPMVRGILLEMQRRKSAYGVDGLRVDGAQDFKYWVAAEDTLYYDDEYLALMNDVTQEVGDFRYRPWMVFEDGRPWPRDDWELSSTYREVTKKLPNVVQWGPLTFAHNTPFLFTFWISKWWRIREITRFGSRWITGTSNHDTLRRGSQVDPAAMINTYLGGSLPEIIKEAYDSPGTRLFDAVMPGIPMDFLNSNSRAPWSFFRNTDDRYGVKVMSEEQRFLDWAVEGSRYDGSESFPRIKAWGFYDREELRRFMIALDGAVVSTGYDLEAIAKILNAYDPPFPVGQPLTPTLLKRIARCWMEDVLDYCNVSQYEAELEEEPTAFSLAVRRFRRRRPWLVEALREGEILGRLEPTSGSVLFYLYRRSPVTPEELLFVGNMEGAPREVVARELPITALSAEGWKPKLSVPGIPASSISEDTFSDGLTLANGEAILFSRGDTA